MSGEFGVSLLQAISDWQRSTTTSRAQTLKRLCVSLPEEYRTCQLVCYRQIALPKDGIWALIGENCLPEKISSWTVAIEVAKAFKGGVPPDGQGYQGTILYLYPPPGSVIVNLSKLYQNPAFTDAMKQHEADIVGYGAGAGR